MQVGSGQKGRGLGHPEAVLEVARVAVLAAVLPEQPLEDADLPPELLCHQGPLRRRRCRPLKFRRGQATTGADGWRACRICRTV